MIRAVPLLLLALAACGDAGTAAQGESEGGSKSAFKTLPCALGEAKDFAPVCKVEEQSVEGQTIWIVWHPDGGFRRFQMIDNGTRIATADGADEVGMTRDGAEFIVQAGPDRYRFPAAQEPAASSAAR
ncbi:MAG: hypothetical protein IPG83_09905 [Novosphingobium sp.]|nr:hypothetical protein [Novosphingobium sp.]